MCFWAIFPNSWNLEIQKSFVRAKPNFCFGATRRIFFWFLKILKLDVKHQINKSKLNLFVFKYSFTIYNDLKTLKKPKCCSGATKINSSQWFKKQYALRITKISLTLKEEVSRLKGKKIKIDNNVWQTAYGRPTDFVFVKIGFSPIKIPDSSRKSIKKNLEITKSILYIDFVNRKQTRGVYIGRKYAAGCWRIIILRLLKNSKILKIF
jgi:hypothetical protein